MPDVGDRCREGSEPFDFVATLLIVGASLGVVVGSSLAHRFATRASHAQCEALLEQWVEQSWRAVHPADQRSGMAPSVTRRGPVGVWQQAVASCEQQLSARQADCALGAPNVDELERCLQ